MNNSGWYLFVHFLKNLAIKRKTFHFIPKVVIKNRMGLWSLIQMMEKFKKVYRRGYWSFKNGSGKNPTLKVCSNVTAFSPSPIFLPILYYITVYRILVQMDPSPIYPSKWTEISSISTPSFVAMQSKYNGLNIGVFSFCVSRPLHKIHLPKGAFVMNWSGRKLWSSRLPSPKYELTLSSRTQRSFTQGQQKCAILP